MNPLRAGLALRLAAACAPRYINVGMPKCGSTSVSSFYQCHGMTSAHWHSSGNFVGDGAHACDVRGRPLLDCGPCRDVYAQIDVENPPGHCWFPQITHLAGLVQDYGNATFLLPTRNATAWAHSTAHCSQTGRPLFGAKPHTTRVWGLGGQGETTPYRQSQ